MNLDATQASGELVIPAYAHIRMAAAESNGGIRILRRGYSFADGVDPTSGALDAGLCFIAFQQDPRTGFIPLQQQLSAHDALREYVRHTGSALFACPPGCAPGGFIGEGLFAS